MTKDTADVLEAIDYAAASIKWISVPHRCDCCLTVLRQSPARPGLVWARH